MKRLPIRARVALLCAGLVAVLLIGLGAFVSIRLRADLVEAVDSGLRSRAEALVDDLSGLPEDQPLAEPEDAFAQILGPDGEVLASSAGLGDDALFVQRGDLDRATYLETEVVAAGERVPARLLILPAGEGRVLVVGASLEDVDEAQVRVIALLGLAGPVAAALAGAIGWVLAGAALRPVERMREEAEAVSASEPGRRLPVSETRDELERLGLTLNRMLDRLEEAAEKDRRFVDDASHELRTPLANLRAELELALRGERSREELEAALRSADVEAGRLTRLAEDLLVLARADRGALPLHRETVDVTRLLEETAASFSASAAGRRVRIEVSASEDLVAPLDPARIRQALGNLVDNAVRHSPDGGSVDLAAAKADGSLEIRVTDQGDGFPPGFADAAFEPFRRADDGRDRDGGGVGLGLSIVAAVAAAHGGTVEARNVPDGGAVVELRLPLVR